MSARTRELFSLVVVGVLVGTAFASVYIARQEVVGTESLSYALFFLGLYVAAHVVTRLTVPHADPYLRPWAGLLTGIGLTEIYRLDEDEAFRQGLWIVIGLVAFAGTLLALRRDYRRLESYKYLFGLGALVLLTLPAMPVIGRTVNGARLWVELGPVRFQPGEFAKICLIVFLAGYLREKREVLAQARLKDLGPLLFIWGGAMAVLVLTNDLGGGLLYFGIFLAMLYVATAQTWFVAAGAAMFVGGAALVYTQVGRVAERVRMWLANGHFGGTGFGQGTFTDADGNQLIPYVSTDFIYSALAQELGLIGISAFLLVYMLFAARGFRIAMLAQDGFSKLLAVGLTFCFTLQTFIIVGGIIRIIPLTGITLPFVSYGGSSIVANFVLLAGLLLVSNRANERLGA